MQFDYVNERIFHSRLCAVPVADATLVDRSGSSIPFQVCNDTNRKQNTSRACYSYHISPELVCDIARLDGNKLRASKATYNAHWTSVIAKHYVPYKPSVMPTFESMMKTVNQAFYTTSGFDTGKEQGDDERNMVLHPMIMEMFRVYLIMNDRYIVYKPDPQDMSTKFQNKYPPFLALIYLQSDLESRKYLADTTMIDVVSNFESVVRNNTFLIFAVLVFRTLVARDKEQYAWIERNMDHIVKEYIQDKIEHNKEQWLATSRFSECYVSNLVDAVNRATREIRGQANACVEEDVHKSYAGTWKHLNLKCIKTASSGRAASIKGLFAAVPTVLAHLSIGPEPDMTYSMEGEYDNPASWQLSAHINSPVSVVYEVMKRQNSLMCRLSMVSASKDVARMRRSVNQEYDNFIARRAGQKSSLKRPRPMSSLEPATKRHKSGGGDDDEKDATEDIEQEDDTTTVSDTLPKVRNSFILSREMDTMVHPSRLRYAYCLGDEMVYASIPITAKQEGRSVGKLDEPEYSPLGLTQAYWEWALKRGRVVYYGCAIKRVLNGSLLVKPTTVNTPPTMNPSRGDERKRDWKWTPIKEFFVFAPPKDRNALFMSRVTRWIEAGGKPVQIQHALDALYCLVDTNEEDMYATLAVIYPGMTLKDLQDSYTNVKKNAMDGFATLSSKFPVIGEWVHRTSFEWDKCNVFQPSRMAINHLLTETTFLRDVVNSRLSHVEPPETHVWSRNQPMLDQDDVYQIVNKTVKTLSFEAVSKFHDNDRVYIKYLTTQGDDTKCFSVHGLVAIILRIVEKYAWAPLCEYWRFRFPVSHIIRMGQLGRSTWLDHHNTNRANPRLYQLHADLIARLNDPGFIKEIDTIHQVLQKRAASASSSVVTTSAVQSLGEIDAPATWGAVPKAINEQDMRVISAALCILNSESNPTVTDKLKAIKRIADPENKSLVETGLHGAFNQIKGSLDHQQTMRPGMVIEISETLSALYPTLDNHVDAFIDIFRELVKRSAVRSRPLSSFADEHQKHSNRLISNICIKVIREPWYASITTSTAPARANAAKQGISRQQQH
jgi:hypothetical protein